MDFVPTHASESSQMPGYGEKNSQSHLDGFYCQPCYKRGLLNIPSFVNLNEFESNRYICESCSFGQTYIISLGKEFLPLREKVVKLENKPKINGCDEDKITEEIINEEKQNQTGTPTQDSQLKPPGQINLTESDEHQQVEQSSDQSSIPEFVKNIQVNCNNESKYSLADIDMYTENITYEYKLATDVINSYEEMIQRHILKWKNKLKAQFEGVIGTFGNTLVPEFLKQLKELQTIQRKIKEIQEILKQPQSDRMNNIINDLSNEIQMKQVKKNFQIQFRPEEIKSNIKTQKFPQISLAQIHSEYLKMKKAQQQKISLYIETLKMSGIRNLSNLKSLYNCCKGFSDAVQILISLQHKQTNRRFDFISEKFKVCSIETLYDAQMINGGYLDNRLEKPPGFDVLGDPTEKKNTYENSVKSLRKQNSFNNKNNEVKISKDVGSKIKKNDIFSPQSINQQQHPNLESQKTNPQEISLISSQSQRQDSTIEQFSHKFFEKQRQFEMIQPEKKAILENPIQTDSNAKQQFNNRFSQEQEYKLEKTKFEKIRNKKPFQSALLNQNKIYKDEAEEFQKKQRDQLIGGQGNIQIDLENDIDLKTNDQDHPDSGSSNQPSLRQYYEYQKGRNLFVTKLELNEDNFAAFPPPEIYMPSVESLTIKYCPPNTDPLQLLKSLKSCFKKLNQLIIYQPKLATQQIIIMIAEYFPRLKSLVFRCKNQFDWQLGKLFEKKMGHLVRFQLNDTDMN